MLQDVQKWRCTFNFANLKGNPTLSPPLVRSPQKLVRINGNKYLEGGKLCKVYSFYFLKWCKNVTYSLCSY